MQSDHMEKRTKIYNAKTNNDKFLSINFVYTRNIHLESNYMETEQRQPTPKLMLTKTYNPLIFYLLEISRVNQLHGNRIRTNRTKSDTNKNILSINFVSTRNFMCEATIWKHNKDQQHQT